MADPFSMFGPLENGGRLYEQDQAANAVRTLSALHTTSQIQDQQSLARYRDQEAKSKQIANEKAAYDQARKIEFETALKTEVAKAKAADPQQPEAPQDSPAAKAAKAAATLYQKYPEQSVALYGKSLTMLENEFKANKEGALTVKAANEVAQQQWGTVAGAYAHVKNAQDKAMADVILMDRFQGKPPKDIEAIIRAPYNPNLVSTVLDMATKRTDQVKIETEKANTALNSQRTKSYTDVNSHRIKLIDAQTEQVKDRDAAIKKGGGKEGGAPTNLEKDAATKFIEEKIDANFNALDEPGQRSFSTGMRFLLDQAKQLKATGKAPTLRAAMEKAYDPTIFQLVKPPVDKEKGSFAFKGPSTVDNPIAAPANPADRAVGSPYTTPDGKLRYWQKDNTWSEPIQAKAKNETDGDTSDEDEEE